MEENHQEELQGLRNLVAKLAKEIDYKNHLLLQKEGLCLEKFTTMSSLVEEKDRLLDERSTVIATLRAQKHRLHEAVLQETQKHEHVKLEIEKLKHALETEKEKLVEERRKNEGGNEVSTVGTSKKGCLKLPNEWNLLSMQHKEQDCPLVKELQELRDHNKDLKARIDILTKELKEKGKALDRIERFNDILVSKEHSSNEELQAARKAAMNYLLNMNCNGTKIGIKRMGEIDPQPFGAACLKKLCNGNWEKRSNELYSSWCENLSDPSWNPFKKKIVDGKLSEVVDENDKKLAELREEWGEEAYQAVVNALLDLKEYNPGARYSIPELWNFEKGRRAYLEEVIQQIILLWEILKKKDAEQSAAIIELTEEKERLSKRLERINILMGERGVLLTEKYRTIGKLMSQDAQKDKLLGKVSKTVSTLTSGKEVLVETCNEGFFFFFFLRKYDVSFIKS